MGQPAHRVNILLVDDREENLLALRTILDDPSYHLVEARSGPEALVLLLQAEFAVILLDVVMPGMDGFEVATMIKRRERSRHVPIIFLSALATDAKHIYRGYAVGAVDYLTQPLDPDVVRAKVAVFVDLYRKTAQIKRQMAQLHRFEQAKVSLEQSARKAAETARHRSQFLAEASKLLFVSLDHPASMQQVAQLALRYCCDWCVIDQCDAAGRLVETTLAHTDPAREALASVWAQPPRLGATIRQGRMVVGRADVAGLAAMLRVADADQVAALGVRSFVWIPLRVRGRRIGALTLVMARPGDRIEAHDTQWLVDFAQRIALALDNERLYRAAQAAIRARAELLGIVSHDLKNPLTAILMNAAYLIDLADREEPEAIRERAESICRSAKLMQVQIRDLLDLTSMEAGQLSMVRESHDVGPLLHEAVELLRPMASAKPVALETEVPALPLWVLCDRARIIQVFSNLIGNAIKFTPAGGTIRVSAARTGRRVRFAVSDNGPGIAPEQVPHLFERFWQGSRARVEGAGLGLSIAKGIVDAHGGTIGVQSAPGAGSTFYFTLPQVARAMPLAQAG